MCLRLGESLDYCVWNECSPLNTVVGRKYYSDEKMKINIGEISDGAELTRFIFRCASSAFDLVTSSILTDYIDSRIRILFWLQPVGFAKQMFRKVAHWVVRSAQNLTVTQYLYYLRVELKQGLG